MPSSVAVDDWRTHPRLQRHVRSFQNHDAGSVLRRYARLSTTVSNKTLLRMMCHAGAWTALLPGDDAVRAVGEDCLSPALLLAQLLRLRMTRIADHPRRGRLTPWLRGILKLVAQRVREAMSASGDVESGTRDARTRQQHWRELWVCLPQKTRQHQSRHPIPSSTQEIAQTHSSVASGGDDIEAMTAEGESDVLGGWARLPEETRAEVPAGEITSLLASAEDARSLELDAGRKARRSLLLLSKEVSRWVVCSPAERDDRLSRMQATLDDAECKSDWCKLVSTLRKAAAALAPPRRRSELRNCQGAVDASAFSSFEGALAHQRSHQRYVQRLVIKALQALRGFEYDERVGSIADYIRSVIARFEERVGEPLERAAGKQWAALSAEVSSYCALAAFQETRPNSCEITEGGDKGEIGNERSRVTTSQTHFGDSAFGWQPSQADTSVARSRRRRSDRAHVGDCFDPADKVKALSTIVHRPEHSRLVECEECGHKMLSSWFFVHPRSGATAVLIPSGGHAECRRRLRRKVHFKDPHEFPRQYDTFVGVDFCTHAKQRTKCAPCGGGSVCTHGRLRTKCRACEHLVKRRGMRVKRH